MEDVRRRFPASVWRVTRHSKFMQNSSNICNIVVSVITSFHLLLLHSVILYCSPGLWYARLWYARLWHARLWHARLWHTRLWHAWQWHAWQWHARLWHAWQWPTRLWYATRLPHSPVVHKNIRKRGKLQEAVKTIRGSPYVNTFAYFHVSSSSINLSNLLSKLLSF